MAPAIELPPFWEENKREGAPSPATHPPVCGVWTRVGIVPLSQEALASARPVAERQRQMAWAPLCPPPLSLPSRDHPQWGLGPGAQAGAASTAGLWEPWRACGSPPLPLGKGLTSRQLYETPGGFLTSSNGRTGWGRRCPRCQLLPAQAGSLLPPSCNPPPPTTDSQEGIQSWANLKVQSLSNSCEDTRALAAQARPESWV